jgi:hypothetical protein
MKNILTISRWELTRIRVRFGGRSRFVILAAVLLAIVAAYLVYQQGIVISKGIYMIGVSSNGPSVADPRFRVISIGPESGRTMLRQGKLDVYIEGDRVISRNDERSQYAAGALKEYMENEELLRIAGQYDADKAFPLRIEVRNLEIPAGNLNAGIRNQAPSENPPETTPPLPATTAGNRIIPGQAQSSQVSAEEASVSEQINNFRKGGLSDLKKSYMSGGDIVIPSLMPPVMPLAQTMLSFLFVLPVLFTSVFFAGSLTEERISRKLIVLLSAPVSPLEIISGKMLPYLIFSLGAIAVISAVLKVNLLLMLAVFVPVTLFIFSAYLMLTLVYRTFKDQTFLSIMVLTAITAYLVIPALLAGVSDLSYISPLTLVVEMFRGESVTAAQYSLSAVPLVTFFCITLFIGTRVFNEEYLTGFKPLHIKILDMLNLSIDRNHLNISAFLSGIVLLPVVFMTELASIVIVSNGPLRMAILSVIIISAGSEELAKSAGVVSILRSRTVIAQPKVAGLATLSALGFFFGEKLFLFLALSVLAKSMLVSAIFGAGLLILPLVLHIVSTNLVCWITARLGQKYYPLAIVAGILIHAFYNIFMVRAFL